MSKEIIELLESAKKQHNDDCMLCAIKDTRINSALDLLKKPECNTCGDTKRVPSIYGLTQMNGTPQEMVTSTKPCPDCQQPPAGELMPWQHRLAEEYDQKQFLKMLERYNQKLSGVWDDDFTIKGSELLTIISLGWGAVFHLEASEAKVKDLLEACESIDTFLTLDFPKMTATEWAITVGNLKALLVPAIEKAKKELKI